MAQSLAQILLHIIFSTKHRQPLIDAFIADELHAYIGGICRSQECIPLKVGGHDDHIHLFTTLSRKLPVMDLLEEVKKHSSKWIKTKGDNYADFYWQDGYAAYSVSPSEVPDVIRYIENQKEHHKTIGFQDECRMLYKLNGIEWDERYVWD